MGQSTNTCILYDKIQHSIEVLNEVSSIRANFSENLSSLIDGLEQLSSIHDNALKASIPFLDEITQNINSEFDMIEKMSFDLLNVNLSFNDAEGKFDSDKLSKAIQNSDFVDDNIKGNIKDSGLKIYSSKEGFEKNLTEEELRVLEQYKEKMEKLTATKVVSNFKTINDFLTLSPTNSFATTFTTTSLLVPSKTPLEFLKDVNGPYSKQGLKELLMEKYPFLTGKEANKVVEQHTGETISQEQDKKVSKEPVSPEENNDDTPSNNSDNTNINYRRNPSYSDNHSPYNDNFSNGDNSLNDSSFDNNSNENFDNNVKVNEQDENDLSSDNNDDSPVKGEGIKNDNEQKSQDDNLDQKTEEDDIYNEKDSLQESQNHDEKSDLNSNDNISIKTTTDRPSILSQIGADLKTSITGGNDDLNGSLDLQTDELSNFSTSASDTKTSAIDDMLSYTPTVSNNTGDTNSSSIAPVAIGLGLAGTTSIAANKIIKKKEKKQKDIINSFIDKEGNNEERRFIPLDAIGDDDLDNSFELEKTSQEDDITPSPEKGKTPEEWYDYIKELY